MTAAVEERSTAGRNGHTVPFQPGATQLAGPAEQAVTQATVSPEPSAPQTGVATSTKRIDKWKAIADEGEALVGIQQRIDRTDVRTDKVMTEQLKAREAYQLLQLAEDPARAALRDARARRVLAYLGAIGLIGSLGWSTANVQATAAGNLTVADPGYWLAFLVEPVVSVGLLLIFGVRAYLATNKGLNLRDRRLFIAEVALLAITLTTNSWLYLPGVAAKFDFIQLFIHSIGPVVAIILVTIIPVLWHYLSIDVHNTATDDVQFDEYLAVARELIAEQTVEASPTRSQLEKHLRIELKARGKAGLNTAMAVRVWKALYGKNV